MYKKIDFHAHYLSPGFKSFLKTYFDDHGDGVKTPDYTIDSTLKTMADNNVEYSIISLSSPHISNTNDAGKTSDLATEANEYGAKQQQTYPDKIGFAASLPLPYVDESIAEIDRARANHASAFTLPTNANGTYLGDPSLDPIMEKLNEQKTLVMLHPNEPKPIAKDVNSELPAPIMEFFFDTTRAVTNMVLHSVFTRYTNIKFIIPHAGALVALTCTFEASGNLTLELILKFPTKVTVLPARAFLNWLFSVELPCWETLTVIFLVIPWQATVIVALPALFPFINPFLETLTILAWLDFHEK
ncbi:amidohydrolase family protein [Pediococcus damnosus]|uniref:amidohydrolase family protein n=1 Tax=Pediococcus damnosus TaxID=51663 RepID=UPI001EDF82CA|nr:amidohydrolase family protein [Pediococcus damnosus]